jgi:hypothetical protein
MNKRFAQIVCTVPFLACALCVATAQSRADNVFSPIVLSPATMSDRIFSSAPGDQCPGSTCIVVSDDKPGTISTVTPGTGGVPLQSGSITLSTLPLPSITDAGSTTIAGFVETSATLQYSFAVIAPSTLPTVPVQVIADLSSVAFGDAATDIGLGISGPGVQSGAELQLCTEPVWCGGSLTANSGSRTYNQTLIVNANTPYLVTLSIFENFTCLSQLSGATNCDTAGSFGDTLDPFIQIDPSFLALNPGVSLIISPGVGNEPVSGAVPEPDSWMIFLSGLVCLAATLGRRGGLPAKTLAS